MTSLWIVTKDIRIRDNLVLKNSLLYSNKVYPVFIIDFDQISRGGSNSIHFLFESLQYLHEELKKIGSCLHIIRKNELQTFINYTQSTKAFILSGFTEFEIQRENLYRSLINLVTIDDCLGVERSLLYKKDGDSYVVFSYFEKHFNDNVKYKLPEIDYPGDINKCTKFELNSLYDFNYLDLKQFIPKKSDKCLWYGGSNYAEQLCTNHNREIELSPYIKFGNISPRIVYHYGNDKQKRGILWRCFYYILSTKNKLILKNINIPWRQENSYEFQCWCTGNTGFDYVDAGINQLLETGIMDNKLRMLVANFLVFGLCVNWREGENFFRKHLVDYDWILNLGNWAWSAQVGVDRPKPNKKFGNKTIRVFNPDTYMTKTADERNFRNSYINKWLRRNNGFVNKICNFEYNSSIMLNYF